MTTNYQTGDQSKTDIKEKLKQDVGTIKQDVSSKARELKQEATAKAREASRQLADKGREKAETLQGKAAETLDNVETAVEAEADALEQLGWDNLSGYIREMANGIGGLSDNLRNKSVDELVRTAAELARRNTGLFVLGSVAIGFGLSRFAKATPSYASESWPSAELDQSDNYSYGENSGSSFASESDDYPSAGGPASDPYQPFESSTPGTGGYPPYESSTDATQKQPFDRH